MKRVGRLLLNISLMMACAAGVYGQIADEGSGEVDEGTGEVSTGRNTGFASWDNNRDERLDRSEFSEAMESHFSRWDSNGDGSINRGEWKKNVSQNYGFREYDSAYSAWDADGSGGLNRGEFLTGMISLFDENGNGYVDSDEYRYWTWEEERN